VRTRHATLLAEARRGQRLRDGLHVVIVGPPNAGKSSLLNALAGSDRAIVTAIAGTTRDLLRETVQLDGIELTLVDTAGLRAHSSDPIEHEGMRRARSERERADLLLAVVEHGAVDAEAALRAELQGNSDPAAAEQRFDPVGATSVASSSLQPGDAPRHPPPPTLWLHTKIDLHDESPQQFERSGETHLTLSTTTGAGLPALIELLRAHAGIGTDAGGAFTARARHVDALLRTGEHLDRAHGHLAQRAGELVAEELRMAQHALAEITGSFAADDLLGEIFGAFCIGK
jgi:tRNA modification GTPase